MSLLSSSLAFPMNPQVQGLFSSQTAFKKPTLNNTFNISSNGPSSPVTYLHPKDFSSKQSMSVKILARNEDPELILCEPVKKVKLSNNEQDQLAFSRKITNSKTQQNKAKAPKLTIEEVFNTPAIPEQAKKGSLVEDCFEEGSSLSFISSCSSLDDADEVDDEVIIVEERKESEDCMILGSTRPVWQADVENLVVKDDVIGRLGYLNYEKIFVNNLEASTKFCPFDIQNTKELTINVPLCVPPNDLNKYIKFSTYNQQHLIQLGLNVSDKTVNEFAKGNADGYDSDSYATRSTSIEQEASQKGASPFYGVSNGLYNEENEQEMRVKAQMKKHKTERVKKQAKKSATDKKRRLLNLKLDVNPKQLKVERRLNRLQLLRYQQGTIDEDEEIKKFGISELVSRTNSVVQENNELNNGEVKAIDNEIQLAFNQFIAEDSQTVIPALGEPSTRRTRVVLAPIWNPEGVEAGELEGYFQKLSEILENPVTNLEAAIKLLNTFNKNIPETLDIVRDNKAFYSEVFRIKVRRLRRGGI